MRATSDFLNWGNSDSARRKEIKLDLELHFMGFPPKVGGDANWIVTWEEEIEVTIASRSGLKIVNGTLAWSIWSFCREYGWLVGE
jgi:hypothetical protein